MKQTLTGTVQSWDLNGHARKFSQITVSYAIAAELFHARVYNASTGKGEQREIKEPHVRKLADEMLEGNFTPAPISVGLTKKQIGCAVENDGNFTLIVDSDEPLVITDGNHRLVTIGRILKRLKSLLNKEKDETEGSSLEETIAGINALPIPVILYLDGDVRKDFINLQKGLNVDPTHVLVQKIDDGQLPNYFEVALKIAKQLNKDERSPFFGRIRFDSRGIAPLPFKTLCASGKSDIGTSLLGLARVAEGESAEELAEAVISVFQTLKEHAPEVMEPNKVLSGEKKGSATMLVGLATCYVYGNKRKGDLVVASRVLDQEIDGDFSGQAKRAYLYAFAHEYFLDTEKTHEGIPLGLIENLSASTFGLSKPKRTKSTSTEDAEQEVDADQLQQVVDTANGVVDAALVA